MASNANANQAQFFFVCGDLDFTTFEVSDFSGTDGVSRPYEFSINLISSRVDIDPDDVVNKQATLYIYRDEEYYPYSGVVTEFHFLDETTDYCRYSVTLVPRLWLLSLNVQSRVFQKRSITDVIKMVLDEGGLQDYELDVGAYPEREYIVQYQESDLNFISRLMENAGIWFLFKETPLLKNELEGVSTERLIISDKPSSFSVMGGESEIAFHSRSGMQKRENEEDRESIHKIMLDKKIAPKSIMARNYNYRTPEIGISGSEQLSGGNVGSIYAYGGDFKDTDGAQKAAKVEAGRIASDQITVRGAGDCRGLRAGVRFTVKEHAREDLNGQLMVREVCHEGSHSALQTGDAVYTYTNAFTAIPSKQVDFFRPPRRAAVPRIPGVITAKIEANGGEYAALDDMGRYKVRLPFDVSDAKNFEASKYVRLAQPYSGSKYGMHFPSHEGSEMILGCIDGDPDKPLGLGTIPNANTISPVVSANKEQNVIRTSGNNEFVLDDTKDKQKIRMTTSAKNAAEFDDENKRIVVQTTDANKVLLDDKNEVCSWNAKDHNITMAYKGGQEGIVITTGGGHVIQIDDNGKKIVIQSNGGNMVEMDDNAGKITLADGKGKNTVTLDGSQGLILDSKGKISLKATQDVIIEGMNISMKANQAINNKANTDVSLEGLNISAKANAAFKASGMSGATLESTANTTVKGTMTKVEGTGQLQASSTGMAKFAGSVTQLESSGPMMIKGAVVMVN